MSEGSANSKSASARKSKAGSKVFTLGKQGLGSLIDPKKKAGVRRSRIGAGSAAAASAAKKPATATDGTGEAPVEENLGDSVGADLQTSQTSAKSLDFEDDGGEDKQIKIGTKLFDFSSKDPIFTMTEPLAAIEGEKVCFFCETELNDDSGRVSCQFCGHAFCSKCCVKQRKFATGTDGKKASGDCCKICDRKFIQKSISKKLGRPSLSIKTKQEPSE